MKLARRFSLVGAALVAALLLVSGCTVTPRSFDTGGRSLTVWTYLAGDTERAMLARIDAIFHRTHPGVDVHEVYIPLEEFGPKLLAANGAGQGPDVIIANPVVDFPLLSSAGVYTDLAPRWNTYPDRDRFTDQGLWRDGGRLYGIHWRFNDLGLWYNQDILDRYHLPVPRTVAELTAAMRTIKAGGEFQPMALAGAPGVQTAWMTMVWLQGDGVNYCDFGSPRLGTALSRLDSWAREGYLLPDTAAIAPEDAFQRFLSGKVAFTVGGNWEVGYVAANPPSFRIGSARIPAGSTGSRGSFAGESVGIGKYATDPDLAWDYLRTAYLSADAQRAMFDVTGALPTRTDVLHSEPVAGQRLTAPFVAALGSDALAPWPDNEKTLDAQTEVGTAFSSMIAGETGPQQTAGRLRQRVAEYFAEGGGGC